MSSIGITRINEKDEEIADGLQTLGMRRMSALSLTGIHRLGTAKTRDIEKIVGLRQPEVSIGVKDLIERGWVLESSEKKTGKGRPCKVYTLKIGFDTILTDIARVKNEEDKMVTASITKLRRMAKESAQQKSSSEQLERVLNKETRQKIAGEVQEEYLRGTKKPSKTVARR